MQSLKPWVVWAVSPLILAGCCSRGVIDEPDEMDVFMAEAVPIEEVGSVASAPAVASSTQSVASEAVQPERPRAAPPVATAENRSLVYFDFDKASLKPEAVASLRRIARQLRRNSRSTVVVQGHADSRGTREYNLALGERRAKAVAAYLIDAGVPSRRIRTTSFGEERLASQGSSEESHALNRRSEIIVRR